MIDHTTRLSGVAKDELHKLTLGKDSVGFAIGPGFGTVPVDKEAGQVYIGPLWMVTVTKRHPLLGYPDIGRAVPVFGVLPPDKVVREAVARLYGECQQEADAATQAPRVKAAA